MCHILTGMPWAMDSFFSSFFCCLSHIYRALTSATLPRLHRYFFPNKNSRIELVLIRERAAFSASCAARSPKLN